MCRKKSLWCRTALSLERNPLSVLRTSDEVDCIITDWHLADEEVKSYREAGLEVIRVKEGGTI